MKIYATLFLSLFIALMLFVPVKSSADNKPIFTLNDPQGDDHGDGTLLYPTSRDPKQGALDLVSLNARAQGDGTEFEAVFAQSIAVPDSRVIDTGGATLASVARLGFYNFNIEIYIDTDRKPASGYTNMLPGRRAQIASDSAWEKIIFLTPRPADTMYQLRKVLQGISEDKLRAQKGRVDPEDSSKIGEDIAMDIENEYFIPSRVRVAARTIRFFVPNSFLNGLAKNTWSYVVAVTATTYENRIDIGNFGGAAVPDGLMNLPVAEGTWSDRLGTTRRGDETNLLPPILDIIVPKGKKQEDILRNFDVNTKQNVIIPGVVPADN